MYFGEKAISVLCGLGIYYNGLGLSAVDFGCRVPDFPNSNRVLALALRYE